MGLPAHVPRATLLLLLCLGLTARAQVAPRFVQAAAQSGYSATLALPFSQACPRGDLVLTSVFWCLVPSVAVSDDQGNTYLPMSPPFASDTNPLGIGCDGGSGWQQMLYAFCDGGSVGSSTLTYFAAGFDGGEMEAFQVEYSGVDPLRPFDAVAVDAGSSSQLGCGPLVTTQSNDVVVAFALVTGAITDAGSGFTTRASFSGDIVEDAPAANAGAYDATASSNGGNWTLGAVALRAPCPACLDAGSDAGPAVDGGTNAAVVSYAVGCDCSAGGGASLLLLLIVIPLRARRRRGSP